MTEQEIAEENSRLMRRIDQEYTAHPFLGSRRLTKRPIEQGEAVNRKRVRRLMGLMGLEAIYPKPKLSVAGRGHRIYPYLPRYVSIEPADQVWSTDITYAPLSSGFMCLAAVIDWFSRYVLAWRLSNTLDGSFRLDILEESLRGGQPEAFNTNQGAQFASSAWTTRLQSAGVRVSMDGRGRCLDNVFVGASVALGQIRGGVSASLRGGAAVGEPPPGRTGGAPGRQGGRGDTDGDPADGVQVPARAGGVAQAIGAYGGADRAGGGA